MLPKIDPELLKKYQEEIAKASSPATMKRKNASLSKFFDWAQNQGHIPENPMQKTGEVYQILQTKRAGRNYKPLLAIASLTLGIIAIILALKNVKLPIPSKKSTAQNEIINQISVEPQAPAILSPWTIFTKLNLKDSSGKPVTTNQIITYQLYKEADKNTTVWTSGPVQQTPDTNGTIAISLDGVPSDVFFQNEKLFLGGTSRDQSETTTQEIPLIQIATANTAINIQGYGPANPEEGATPNTVPVISSDGSLLLASESPAIKATNGNLLIEGQAVTINAPGGEINILSNLKIQDANIKSGSLISGYVGNNLSNYDLINLSSGSTSTEKFSVDALGNTYIAGNTTIGGTLGINNLSVNNITASGNITDIKKGTALSDLVTLTLDERGKPASSNSIYSTLVLKRYDGAVEAAALYVDEGNAIFDGQVQLGRYIANPDAIGKGSLVFNTSDNQVYVWNGSAWNAVGSLAGGPSAFSDITTGTNTTAAMVVGSGATLGFTGTGTITASELTCTGCIANSELANSSVTINSSGILTGGGSVSLGGTLSLTATEADTLASVTGRGATTTNAVSVGDFTSTGITTFNGIAYTWPAAQTASGFLQTNGSGTLGWATIVPASSVPFSGITSGTNTTAAMVVGTGASLDYVNSGTVNASSLIGATWAAPGTIGSTTANSGAFTTVNATTGVNT
ncbi:MAG: hypothetical protein NTV24_03940, partial [Candidatus Woesebacteria bacterium]|nr:hypothetical protein [Candidatus Woesebacteria bacterium]